jgi:hypothetical protein
MDRSLGTFLRWAIGPYVILFAAIYAFHNWTTVLTVLASIVGLFTLCVVATVFIGWQDEKRLQRKRALERLRTPPEPVEAAINPESPLALPAPAKQPPVPYDNIGYQWRGRLK